MSIKKVLADTVAKSNKCIVNNIIPPFDIDKYFRKKSDNEELMILFHEATIGYYRELHGNFISSFFKRIIRRTIRFCIIPFLNDISYFNKKDVMALMNMNDDLNRTKESILKLEEEIRLLKEKS